MRDIMEMSYEAYRAMKGNTAKQQEMFAGSQADYQILYKLSNHF